MLIAVLKALHVIGVVVWIGGMAFAHFFLRPSLAALEAPLRLRLLREVLGRFFATILVVAPLTWASGGALFGRVAGATAPPPAWSAMALLGSVMLAIFLWLRFAPYPRLVRAVAGADWPAAGAAMAQIRRWVAVNLAIGAAVLVIALIG